MNNQFPYSFFFIVILIVVISAQGAAYSMGPSMGGEKTFYSSRSLLQMVNEIFPKPADAEKTEYDNVPTRYIDEALLFRSRCEADPDKILYYNCECLSVKYLDQRILRGDDYDGVNIEADIQAECKDGTRLADTMYNACFAQRVMPAPGQDYEKFCACFGNEYAKSYESVQGVVSANTQINIRTNSILTCKSKGTELN